MIVKNTYGISVAFATNHPYGVMPKSEFSGSALQRKKQVAKPKSKTDAKPITNKEKKQI